MGPATLRRSILIFVLICSSFSAFAQRNARAQKDSVKYRKLEIGYNITTVLSHFLGNENNIEDSDFPLMFRFRMNKTLLRLAVGVTGSSSEFFDNVSGIFRENDVSESYLRLGIEKEFFKENKWTGYFGMDFIGEYKTDKIVAFGFNQVEILNRTIGFGAGPFLGIKFQVNKRLYLHTESNLYFVYRDIQLSQAENGIRINLEETSNSTLSLQSPLSLYLNYRI